MDVVWRSIEKTDSLALLGLIRELEEGDKALFRTSLTEVEEMLDRPGLAYVVGGDAVGGPDPGKLVVFGYVGLARSGKPEAICHGGVLPGYRDRGIGKHLLTWQTECGSELLQEGFPDKKGNITHVVDARRTNMHAHLESQGYKWTNSFAELRRDLTDVPESPKLSSFVEIVPWTDKWEEEARKAFNRAAKRAGTGETQNAKQWEEARAHLTPGLSFLALDRSGDRPRVTGLIEVGLYQEDWEALGWKEGYIDTVAVFDPSMRGTLLRGLLARSLQAMAAAGLERAAVGLDPEADPEMEAYYESFGFKPHAWWRHYAVPSQKW